MVVGCAVSEQAAPERGNAERSTPARPNLVVFLVDNLGWQDVSLPLGEEPTPFNARYRTPTLERLAAGGVTFTNAYAASPVCTPTRTSLLTGRNPARTRITNWTLRNDRAAQETGPKSYPLRSPEWRFGGLTPEDRTLPAVLRDAGYRTAHVGKAHFGALGTAAADPTTLGFEINVAGHAAGAPGSFRGEDGYRGRGDRRVWDVPGLEAYDGTDLFLTDALTRESLAILDDFAADERPFFLHLSHYAVHVPLAGHSPYYERYLAEGLDEREAMYASMIEGVDASLAAVLARLEELGIADETIVVFLSDNGGLTYAARGKTPTGTGANTHNAPLRSGKGSAYEGGTRIPMVVGFADGAARDIDAGSRTAVPVITDDLFPTLLELARLTGAASGVDGTSLVPLLEGRGADFPIDRSLCWHYPHKWGPDGPGYDPFTSIRHGRHKLIHFYLDGSFELYDLESDLGETQNLVEDEPEVARALAAELAGWMREVDAQTPIVRETGRPLPVPALP